jgi:ectoine hydroxylase-related dioxygenase (phytanoyl-CoA dioxygenase family)
VNARFLLAASDGAEEGLARRVREVLAVPEVVGALESLAGPGFHVDDVSAHVKNPHDVSGQPLHVDGAISVRKRRFDLNVMYFPTRVSPELGGTLVVPGSQFRAINEGDTARYQNLAGQYQINGSAGTIAILHHGVWHCGRPNFSDETRTMIRIRISPRSPQVRIWDTSDLYTAEVVSSLQTRQPWWESPVARLEIIQRIDCWRWMADLPEFDIDRIAERAGVSQIRSNK